jgi:hypothetical protein
MRVAGLWLLPLLAGCYPFISQPWSHYADTSENGDTGDTGGTGAPASPVRVIGLFEYLNYVGGYWDESHVQGGTMTWAYLDQASTTATPLSFELRDPTKDCTGGFAATDVGQSTSVSAKTSKIKGPDNDDGSAREITLDNQLDTAPGIFTGAVASDDAVLSGEYDLESVSLGGGLGTISVKNAVSLKKALDFTGPPIDGATMGSGVPADLSITWEPDATVPLVLLWAESFDPEGNAIQWRVCYAPGTAGTLAIPTTGWNNLQAISGWTVIESTVSQYHAALTGGKKGEKSFWFGQRDREGYLLQKDGPPPDTGNHDTGSGSGT